MCARARARVCACAHAHVHASLEYWGYKFHGHIEKKREENGFSVIKMHFRFNICVSLIGFKFRSIQRNKHRMQLRFYNGLRYTDTSWMWRNLEDLAPEKRQTYSKVLEIHFKGFNTPYKLCNYQLIHFKTSWDDLPLVTMLGLTFQYICGLPRLYL